jgi:hypothetical protein
VEAESDPTDGDNGRREEGRDSPPPLAQQDRDRDRKGSRRVIARKAWISGVRGEEVDAVGVGDKGPGAVDQFGDQLANRQGKAGAQHGGDSCPPPIEETWPAGQEKDDGEGGDEEKLGGFDVEEDGVLEAVVAGHEVVQGVQQRPIHC